MREGDVERGIDARLDDWEARLDRLETTSRPALRSEAAHAEHVVFVPSSSGYELVERSGELPVLGELVELEDHEVRYAVARIAPSPLPGDGRRCAYLEAI